MNPQATVHDSPAELVEKIFVYSLPRDPLDQKQPNVRIAPLLLCHVCSRWRTIALQLPRLWMCLYHVVRIPSFMRQESGLLNKGIQPTNLEFLEWWWCNLGANHPFRLRFLANFEGSYFHPEDGLPVQEHILISLFNLAQHLDINQNVARMIYGSPITFPRLQTLRIRSNNMTLLRPGGVFPVRPEHPIRKLHMQRFEPWDPDVFERPILSWSSLTHIVFTEAHILIQTWFDLIRTCVNLQFGYIKVCISRRIEQHLANAPHFTHRHLRQLVVVWDNYHDGQNMLKNLFLPSLTALRISASLTTKEFHCILESAPSLIELHLGDEVAPDNIWCMPFDNKYDPSPEPLSKYVPNLKHLVIQYGTYVYLGETVRDDINGLLMSNWLQLGEPTSTVCTLEIRALTEVVDGLRRELNERLAGNPIYGLKVDVVDSFEPLVWTSSTALEKSEAIYFEGANFGKGPGCII